MRRIATMLMLPFVCWLSGCGAWMSPQSVATLKGTVDDLRTSVADWQETAQVIYDQNQLTQLNPKVDRVEDTLAKVSAAVGNLDPNNQAAAEAMVDAAIATLTAMAGQGIPYIGIILAALFGLRAAIRSKNRTVPPTPPTPPNNQ